jgi:hypothetical protein
MLRNGANLDQKQRWMRESHVAAVGPQHVPEATGGPTFAQRHYTPAQIASMWNLSQDKVRDLFQHEAGVLVIGEKARSGRRAYTTLRIPESVAARVHRRLSNVG